MARVTLVISGFLVALLATESLGRECRGFFCRDRPKCDAGVSCKDCSTRQICTPVGSIELPCWLPGLRHCSNGRCVREPSPECSLHPTTTNRPHPTRPTTTEASTETATDEPDSTTNAASTTDSASTESTSSSTTDDSTSAEPSSTDGSSTTVSSTTETPTTDVSSTTEEESTKDTDGISTTDVSAAGATSTTED